MGNWRQILAWNVIPDPESKQHSGLGALVGKEVQVKSIQFTDYDGNIHIAYPLLLQDRGRAFTNYIETENNVPITGKVISIINKIRAVSLSLNDTPPAREISRRPYRRTDGTYSIYPNGEEFMPLDENNFILLANYNIVFVSSKYIEEI